MLTITGDSPIYPPRNNDPRAPRPNNDDTRVNDQIRVPKVRVIDEDGEMLGVMTTRAAIERAEESGLDLVEVSPNADPPVCKILDYGKFRYQQQKKKNEAKKKQKTIDIKELKLRPSIEDHDLGVKLRAAVRFLENGDKVKFSLRFRGREMAHQQLGFKVMERVKLELEGKIRIDQEPKLEGNQMIMMVSPAVVAPVKAVADAKEKPSESAEGGAADNAAE